MEIKPRILFTRIVVEVWVDRDEPALDIGVYDANPLAEACDSLRDEVESYAIDSKLATAIRAAAPSATIQLAETA
jgi:hypothetical protein